MNREIKFRGKTPDGEWVYGFYFTDNHRVSATHNILTGELDSSGTMETFEIIPSSVGQFTGLKDKNGKEIYDGDIVKFNTISRKGIIRVVEYGLSAWMPFNDMEFIDGEQGDWFEFEENPFEIIGNIYENPELVVSE